MSRLPPADARSIVATGYDRVTTDYRRLEESGDWPRLRWLREVSDRLPDEAAVLDLGCGSADPAGMQIARRHQLTGVDVSPAHIDLARKALPGAEFICASATEVAFPPDSFDAVVTFYTLDHIPRRHHEELFRKIYHWLRPGGLLLLSVEDSDQPDTIGKWLGVDMFFSHFDAATTERLVRDAGSVVEKSRVEVQDEAGTDVPYLWLLGAKP